MEQEIIKKFEEKKLAPNSIKIYMRNLSILNDKRPITNLNFLKNTETIENKIKDYSNISKRNFYIAICSVLRLYDKADKKNKTYDFYYNKLKEYNNLIKENDAKNVKTEKQEKNWIEWDEVLKKRDELKNNAIKLKKPPITHSEYNNLLDYLILSLYTMIPPRRNQDYVTMLVTDKNKDLEPNKNYLVLDKKGYYFQFGKYKTKKTFGVQKFEIPEDLSAVIKQYLKFKPQNDNFFLVEYDGKRLNESNGITLKLNHIFGKNISSSMLRHIYLSHNYADTRKDQQKDSQALAHNISTQAEYIKY